jgi:iron-sulfur cluster repair protein YtfE (RIC family)
MENFSVEQLARLDCGCGGCMKLFKASQRWLQNIQERTQELEQMTIAELQLSHKFVATQFSTVV